MSLFALALPALGGLFGGGNKKKKNGFGAKNVGVGKTESFGPSLDYLMNQLTTQTGTNPLMLNRVLAESDRATQTGYGNVQETLARLGLSGSGVGQAVGAATQTAGADRRAGIMAQDAQLAQQRRDEASRLLMQLLGLELQGQAIQTGQFNAKQAADAQKQAALIGGLGSLGGGLLSGLFR